MYGHGGIFSLHAFHCDSVFFSEFILQALLYIADTDFPEEIRVAFIVGTQNLFRLFPGHSHTIVRHIYAESGNGIILLRGFIVEMYGDMSASLRFDAVEDGIFYQRL